MLTSTFQHLDGIGPKRERELWSANVYSWEELARRRSRQLAFLPEPLSSVDDQLALSRNALQRQDAEFFAQRLAPQEYYRIALSFPSKTMFLDIETTGLSRYYNDITLIGWSLDGKYNAHIRGQDATQFRDAVSHAKALVTFNGSLFDLPFLHKEFPTLRLPSAHVDLRFFSRRVGFSGGQKAIEQSLGIARPAAVRELDGSLAPLLWHAYLRGDASALTKLLHYNHADIIGLQRIFVAVVGQHLKERQIPQKASTSFRDMRTTLERRWPVKMGDWKTEGISTPVHSRVSLCDVAAPQDMSNWRFIGIDLAALPSRPSGWCLLTGDTAHTRRIESDADLLAATLEAKPLLVSIDAPLTLPKGRTAVTDDDPGRATFGITRDCERILKRRGVNVYPCLIRSMQKLTARGIRLAQAFRSMGIPVIESFPGAAQDILGIPRKGAGPEFLKLGLEEFGIQGEYQTTNVSHDELDAITSAIVALFFRAGKYEALGNEEEDYLIIPRLQRE